MAFTLPALPYARDALAPHISENTLNFHYGKHHQAYVDNLNKLVAGTPLENAPLEEVVKQSWAEKKTPIFNNAGQVWNHTFYWHSMKPQGGGKPTGLIADRINKDFGSFEEFKNKFAEAGTTQFGSGWAWLSLKDGKLVVSKSGNAETPLTEAGVTPLITMDVWEHAYYLDYQNLRPKYINTFLDELVNWDHANQALSDAK